MTRWGIKRTIFLCLLAAKEGGMMSEVVDQMASLGDKKGLKAVSVMVKKFSILTR